jgi:hypothetical protein
MQQPRIDDCTGASHFGGLVIHLEADAFLPLRQFTNQPLGSRISKKSMVAKFPRREDV